MKNLLLIRGLSREKRHWGEFPDLVENNLDIRVHTLDNLGCGEFYEKETPLTIRENVDFLQEQFEKLYTENPGEWYLLGISLGGMFVAEWAQRINPFKKVFVINSSIKNLSPLFDRITPHALQMMTKSFVLSGQKQEEIIYDLTSYRGSTSEHGYFKTNEWLSYREQFPMSRENFFRQLACAATYKLEKKPKNDMVFISARGDELCKWTCGKAIADFCDSPFYLCEEPAGHDLPMDCPKFIINVLKKEIEFHVQYTREAESISENLSAL